MNVKQVSKLVVMVSLLVVIGIGLLALAYFTISARTSKALEVSSVPALVTTSYQSGTYHRVESGTVVKFSARVTFHIPACMLNSHVTAVALSNVGSHDTNVIHNDFGHPACVPNGDSVVITPKDTTSNNDTPTLEASDPIVPNDDTPTITPDNNEPAVPVVPSDDTPSNPPTVEPRVHCNNGEGNSGEGCSPAQSENANNDENNTTPREDKSKKN